MAEVTDINEYRQRLNEELNDYLDWCEGWEQEMQISLCQSIDAFIDKSSNHWGVHPALTTEGLLIGIFGILGHAIREQDCSASKDVMNWASEIATDIIEGMEIKRDRDTEERQEWREATYIHRHDTDG